MFGRDHDHQSTATAHVKTENWDFAFSDDDSVFRAISLAPVPSWAISFWLRNGSGHDSDRSAAPQDNNRIALDPPAAVA